MSDKRNENGFPYVFHNQGQTEREEDFLSRKPVTGHFRFEAEKIEESEEIAATFLFLPGPEDAYNSLKDGNWPENTEDYFVIHSFASSMKARGAATFCFEWCEKQPGVRCIKVDTHKNNIPMQNLLKKLGYAYCGKCYYFDEARFGEKIINETECLAFCKSIDDSEILKRDYDAERLAFCKKI